MEHYNPDMLANLSTCKSPQQMFGALAKTYYAEKIGMKPEDIFVVSIMPCTAKKFEAARPGDERQRRAGRRRRAHHPRAGAHDQAGRHRLPPACPTRRWTRRSAVSTGAADIFANTGGVMEAALRTVYEIVTGTPFPFADLHVEPIARPRGRQGGDGHDRGSQGRLGVPRGRRPSRSPSPTASATPRRSSTRSRAAKPSITSSRS